MERGRWVRQEEEEGGRRKRILNHMRSVDTVSDHKSREEQLYSLVVKLRCSPGLS